MSCLCGIRISWPCKQADNGSFEAMRNAVLGISMADVDKSLRGGEHRGIIDKFPCSFTVPAMSFDMFIDNNELSSKCSKSVQVCS